MTWFHIKGDVFYFFIYKNIVLHALVEQNMYFSLTEFKPRGTSNLSHFPNVLQIVLETFYISVREIKSD